MSLYLQYRPKSFDQLVGQHHISDIIQAQIGSQKFSHTYLLYGPRGTGKTTTARLLAKAVNIPSGDLLNDPIAQLIDKGQTIDYVEIDAASHTGVDNIREEIIDKALYPPTQLKKKVYVIDEVHMLSKGAFNALLKIMEEPPEYLLFILATTEIHKVPDTIVSRSQVFNFKRITIDDIVGRLEHIAQEEQIEYDTPALRLIAKMSNGGVRDAIKYLEQIGMLGKVTEETVSTFLGVVSEQSLVDLLDMINQQNFEQVVAKLDSLQEQGADMSQLAKDILRYLDEHFMDDPARFAQLAQVFKDITIGIKSYPHPIIIYKMHLWEAMHGTAEKKTVSNQGTATKITEKTVADTPVQSTGIQYKEPAEERKEDVSELDKPADTMNIQQQPAAVDSEIHEDTSTPSGSDTEHTSPYEALMQQLVAQVDKVMIKSILKKSVVVDQIQDDVLEMIVINEQYYNTLNKQDITIYLQDLVTAIRGSATKLKWTYMNKEAYLQKQLAG